MKKKKREEDCESHTEKQKEKIRQRRCVVVQIKRSRNGTYGVKGEEFVIEEL
jgi:hypothetical protein